MSVIIAVEIFIISNIVECSIDGLSYMDPINMKPLPGRQPRGEDPCNPLYWYPRNIPEYCNYRNFPVPKKPAVPPLPMPLPVPVPQPPLLMPMPPPQPLMPPLPYGIPIAPANPMLPIAPPLIGPPYPFGQPIYPSIPSPFSPYLNNGQQAGMVPGLPGLVSKDGGINILPFSDAYSDLLENHKNKMIRRRLQKLIQEYEDFPNARSYRRLRKYARRNT